MELDFEKLMTNKSDEGLQEYLDNRTKYTSEAIEAAIAEMKKRGRTFSDEELANLRNELQAKRDAANKEEDEFFRNPWNTNIVSDENAPAYYSERAIFLFSAFFSVIFGAVLLSINCRSTEFKKNVWKIMVFGIVYTGLQLWVLSLIPRSTILTFLCSMVGALLMNYLFWKRYIGKDTKYRAKPIWKPLIIGLIIFIPFILAAIYVGV